MIHVRFAGKALPAGAGLLVLLILAAAGQARAQDPSLGSFYGSQNLQYVTAGYAPALTAERGSLYELMFGFNTSSKRTEGEKLKFFYGVGLGGGGFSLGNVDLGEFEKRDGAGGYGRIRLEGKVFFDSEGPVRPYFGFSGGMGSGQIWLKDKPGAPNPDLGSVNLYTAGVETGVHVDVGGKFSIVAGAGMELLAGHLESEPLVWYPAMFYVGISRWLGPID